MAITGYITSKSAACTLDNDFFVSEYMADIGFTFVDKGHILNNGISLLCPEVPEGVMLAIDPYGRIIVKSNDSADPDSEIKLKIVTIGEESFECTIKLNRLLIVPVGSDFEFTMESGESGEGPGGVA